MYNRIDKSDQILHIRSLVLHKSYDAYFFMDLFKHASFFMTNTGLYICVNKVISRNIEPQ